MPPRIDFTSQRLFVDQPMAAGAELPLDKAQSNYLLNVLRMREGARLLAFNGRDGEWRAELAAASRKAASLRLLERTREQPPPAPLWLCFAPIKAGRLDWLVQKAVEMGAARLVPVMTARTQVELKNPERLRANIIEAAEQCGVLAVPELGEPLRLPALGEALIAEGRIPVFCDEMAEVADPLQALAALPRGARTAALIGPEGGFDEAERRLIRGWPGAVAIALGPRILRADTAAVAALAVLQLAAGDWR
jgi:16S rRNA (uracil1498-N3)-methyltransferase